MTVMDDRLETTPPPSNLTTVPRWHPRAPKTRPNGPHLLSSPQASRGEVKVYVEGANLPWWVDDHLNLELNRLFSLPAGWDGFSSDAVTIDAIQEVVTVLLAIIDEFSLAPQFFPLRDGGIQAEWHVSGNDIEIEVSGTGETYVFAERSDGQVVADGEVRSREPGVLLRAVKTFLSELSLQQTLAH